ncbi:MAG TPA: sugar phosphate isomerase/epimerase family protein [Terriglobia bacterium]|nr:sugar phosphate isomerase/epimerase family protein [Terriglobia bacterium]
MRSSTLKICLGLFFAGAAWTLSAQAQQLPTGNPRDFKVKTCLHSVSYAGVWRGQVVLSVDEFLVKAKDLGYDGVEIMCKRPHLSPLDYDEAARQRLRARIDQLGLKLVALAAYTDFSAGMDKPGIPQVEIQAAYLGEVARLAHDLGTNLVRVFTGYDREGIPYDQQYNAVVQGLRLGGQQAARYGVTLAVQNHHDLAVSAEGMYWLLKEVNLPNVQAAWDAWSPSAQGLTPAEIRQGVQKLKPFIVHTTAAQYVSVPRYHYLPDIVDYQRIPSVNLEVPMGPGMIDYDSFFNSLKEIGYQGYVAYEICAVTEGGGSIENLDRTAKSFLEYMKKFR